jgi:hypothetical protein
MIQFLVLAALGVYIWGALKFMGGAKRYYEPGKALPLALLWPLLLATNGDFRRNFQRTLKP